MTQFSNIGKTYEKPTINNFHGFEIRRQHDVKLADGRTRTTLYLYCGGKKLDEIVVSERKGIAFETSVDEKIHELVKKNCAKILDLVRNGEYTDISLDGFYFLVGEKVAVSQKWLRNAVTYRKIWADTLCAQIGDFKLSDAKLLEKLKSAPELFSSKTSHREISGEEIQCRRFIGGLLRYAEQDGLIAEGISKEILKNTKTHESTIALRALAKRSFSQVEFARFVELCLNKDEPVYHAILLRALTGLTIAVVCGLNIGDYQSYQFPTSDGERICWLSVTKEYKQPRREEPALTYLLDGAFAYHRFPCTDEVNSILSRQKRERKKTDPSAGNDAPLFVGKDGKRLTPNEVKEAEEQLISEAVLSPINLPIGRGSKGGRFRGEFLRANARYHFHCSSYLDDQEASVLLGVKPTEVYATNYVDWSHPYVLVMLREKLERWHRQFLNVKNTGCNPSLYQATVISGTAHKDTTIMFRSAYGVAVAITPYEDKKGA